MKDDTQISRTGDLEAKSADGLASDGEKQINHSRRRLARAGLAAAPVLVTLASRPVFGNPISGGGRCLSNMMSGNLSTANVLSCSFGDGPDIWKEPLGSPLGESFINAWAATGYSPGTVKSDPPGLTGWNCSDYEGGTTLGDTPLAGLGETEDQTKPLLQLMCEGNALSNCVAALLNARFSAYAQANGIDYKYILDVGDVVKYCDDPDLVLKLGFDTLDDFLKYTFGD